MESDTNIEGDHECRECESYDREVKALRSRLEALQRAVSILAQSVAACEGVSLADYMRTTKEDPAAINLIDSLR